MVTPTLIAGEGTVNHRRDEEKRVIHPFMGRTKTYRPKNPMRRFDGPKPQSAQDWGQIHTKLEDIIQNQKGFLGAGLGGGITKTISAFIPII